MGRAMKPNHAPTAAELRLLAAELADATSGFGPDRAELLALHGVTPGPGHDFTLAVRVPGGRLNAAQFLALDDIADRYGDGTLHLAPRQRITLGGVLKRDLKEAIGVIDLARLTTFAAGGNVPRVSALAPRRTPAHRRLEVAARRLAEHLTPSRRAYEELWLEGERDTGDDPEDFHLPTTLEVGLALPEDDAIDVLTSDLAILALDDGARLEGYNLALGGAPRHRSALAPRLAPPVAFVPPDELPAVAAALVRLDRNRAEPPARTELEAALGRTLASPRPMPQLRVENHRGWREQGDGKLYLGLPIPEGRVADSGGAKLRTALRLICKGFGADVMVTPYQDLVLGNIAVGDRLAVDTALVGLGVTPGMRGAASSTPSVLKEAS
jgi:sulfite reductase (ferredoxin)